VPASPPPASHATPAAPSPAEWASWRRLVQVYVGRDSDSAEIRARLVQWVTALTPWLLAINAVAAVLLAVQLRVPYGAQARTAWCGAICGMWLLGLRSWWRHRGRVPQRLGPSVVRKGMLHAAVMSSLWALLPWAVYPGGSHGSQLMVAGVMPSMIAGAGFVLNPIAPAALLFALVIGVSTSAAVALTGARSLCPCRSRNSWASG